MLKMYMSHSLSGNMPEFWEDNWESSAFEEALRFMAVDPLRPLFERYLRPDSLMLEGGCGMGNYVVYYSARGYNVVGLDFAQKALKTLGARQPGLRLVVGDVSEMPFPSRTFDLYYSGGVVEHFEGGAEKSLSEARRVLKDDGVLLISVPYYSPLRRALLPFKRDSWRVVTESSAGVPEAGHGVKFFQYAYKKKEFERMLSNSGLRIIETQGYAVLWGLYDIPILNRSCNGPFNNPVKREQNNVVDVDISWLIKNEPQSLIKRLVVGEDDKIPLLGIGVRFMRWAAANMMMYVCRPS